MSTKSPIYNFIDIYTNYSVFLNSYLNKNPKTQVLDIHNEKIENYSKKLLKSIFSSNIYRNNFLKYDKRFNLQNKEKIDLLESIFQGENSQEIFEEQWNNIFFLPFLDKELSGFNSKNQFSIFINSTYEYEQNTTFQKIIPQYHCAINTLYHEFIQYCFASCSKFRR